MIRFVKESDAQNLLNIYAPYVTDNAVSFEYVVPTVEEFVKRIRCISAEYPYLVAIREGAVAGYAYAHRQMERSAYQWNAELSVYVASEHKRKGIGRMLYSALIEILKLQNIHNVYGSVTVSNVESEALHDSLGFIRLGTYHNTGYKCGAWHDVVWFEKNIAAYDLNPLPFKPLSEIAPAEVIAILDRFE